MAVKQIYDIVNSVNKQTMGVTDLTIVDEQGLISLGQTVLTTNGLADTWLNSLAQRIGKTIISFREYKTCVRKSETSVPKLSANACNPAFLSGDVH